MSAPDARVHVVPLAASATPGEAHPAGWPFVAHQAATWCAMRDGSARELLAWSDVADLDGFLDALRDAMLADGWHYHTLAPGARTGTLGAYHRGELWRVLNVEPRDAAATVTMVEGRWEHFWPGAPPRD